MCDRKSPSGLHELHVPFGHGSLQHRVKLRSSPWIDRYQLQRVRKKVGLKNKGLRREEGTGQGKKPSVTAMLLLRATHKVGEGERKEREGYDVTLDMIARSEERVRVELYKYQTSGTASFDRRR